MFVFSEDIRRYICRREFSPFRHYVGQDEAVEEILDLVFQSSKEGVLRENLLLTGPPSTGKTTLVKNLAEMMNLQAVFTDCNQVNGGVGVGSVKVSPGADTITHLILDRWAQTQTGPLEGHKTGSFTTYEVPPTVVFIDEIHGLGRKISDSLLKAMERADAILFSKSAVLDCRDVLWVGATTSWGKMSSAFRSRFSNRIDLKPLSRTEVATVVKLNHPDLSDEACRQIVFYGGIVPREALAFARKVERYAERAGVTPENCVAECARRQGIDRWGMIRQRVDILRALRNNVKEGLILRNLCAATSLEAEEAVNVWLPPLMFDSPPLVSVHQSCYVITERGLAELAKRDQIIS